MLGKKLGENSIFNKIKKLNLDLLMVFSFELSTVGTGTLFFNRNKLSIRFLHILYSWIRIRIEKNSWIRIHIK